MTREAGDSQEKEMNTVVDRLIHESQTTLSHEEVEIIFKEAYSRLAVGARIKAYLQLLSYRLTMEHLRSPR